MMEYEIADILFFVNSIKTPHGNFDITNYVNFSVSNTRSSTYLKLRHSTSKRNYQGHFYFNRFPSWNSLPSFDIHLSISTIKSKLRLFSGISFFQSLIPTILVHTITCVHAKNVPSFLSICISIILCYKFLFFYFFVFLFFCCVPPHPLWLLALPPDLQYRLFSLH